jgi:uncharacterized membrane protein YfcA
MQTFLLLFFGFITGLIDSVVGGGGLISLPFLSWVIAPGPEAIGTNKIVGTVGAFIALIVYARKGHLLIKSGILFCVVCAVGSFCGSSAAPYLPIKYFKLVIILICPIILYIVYHPEKFFKERENYTKPHWIIFFSAAFFSGFYDGFFGPGGGTFMFLSLYLGTGLPLLTSIAISKLANTFSAFTALLTYAKNGYVHFKEGSIMALGMALGSYLGATHASKNSQKVVRPALAIVASLLLIKLIFF